MSSLHRLALTASVAGLLAIANDARANVFVVDATNGPHFQVNSAVAAASDGDVILIKSGNYPGFSIVNKSLSVVSDADADVLITGSAQVSSLAAGKVVVLHRLTLRPPTHSSPALSIGILLQNNLGRVRVQGCSIRGANGFGLASGCVAAGPPGGRDGVQIVNCADVAIQLCVVNGGDGGNLFAFPACDGTPQFGGEGGDAVDASGSMVTIHDSGLQGGVGGSAWLQGGVGGAGLRLRNATAFCSNVAASAGDGGWAGDCIVTPIGGDGGHGLDFDAPSLARLLSVTLLGGDTGSPGPCGVYGTPGSMISGAGTSKVLAGPSKGLGGLKVLRENQAAGFLILGEPGETAFLLVSPTAEALWAPGLRGVLMVGSPLIGPVLLGSVPAGGVLSAPYTAPLLPPSVQGVVVHVQGALVPAAGLPTLTGVSILTLLDASF